MSAKGQELAIDKRAASTEPHYSTLGLTEKQADFVRYFVLNGGNSTEAAALANYANPGQAGYLLKNTPRVAEAIARLIRREIMTDGLRMAWGVVKNALQDENLRPDIRLKAAYKTIDYAEAALEREAAQKRGGAKPMEEQSLEELRATLEGATAALGSIVESAKPVGRGSGE